MTRLLLVEDEPDLRLVLQTRLGLAGIETVPASNLDEARSALNGGSLFDGVLLDILLNGESGWMLLDELKGSEHPPVIIISAYDSPETKQRASDAGCQWLPKPFTPAELAQALQRAQGAAQT